MTAPAPADGLRRRPDNLANAVRQPHRRAFEGMPRTVNADTRSVEVVASTGAPVRRLHGRPDGEYGPWWESLDLAGADLNRLLGGAVLRDHVARTEALIGVVEAAAVEGGELRATVRFSDRPDVEPLWRDVQGGILRAVSVGYLTEEWTMAGYSEGLPVFKATRWTPYELSFVAVAADACAGTRSLPNEKDPSMAEIAIEGAVASAPGTATRSEPNTAPSRLNMPDPAPGTPEHARAIRSICLRHLPGVGDSVALDMIQRGVTLDQAGTAVLNELARRSDQHAINTSVVRFVDSVGGMGASGDDPIFRRAAMAEALAARYAPGVTPGGAARQFAEMSVLDMTRDLLASRGERVGGLRAAKLYERAITTEDFPGLLTDAGTRVLQAAYEAAPPGVRAIARQTSAPDFRAKMNLRLSAAPTFVKVGQGGEFEQGGMAELKESYKLDTYGRVITLTRQAIVNDDLGAFAQMNTRFGFAAAEFVSSFLVNLLWGPDGAGPVMSDGKPLFHADHDNLANAGAAPEVTTLGAGREAMRLQRDVDGATAMNVVPRYLVVPAALETAGEQLLTAIQATAVNAVNPFPGKLELAVDPRLDAKSRGGWYLAADPAFGTLEYAYLDGQSGPDVVLAEQIDIDGLKVRARLDFGAGVTDWRGFWRNPGADPSGG